MAFDPDVTRRSFLKMLAVASASGALPGEAGQAAMQTAMQAAGTAVAATPAQGLANGAVASFVSSKVHQAVLDMVIQPSSLFMDSEKGFYHSLGLTIDEMFKQGRVYADALKTLQESPEAVKVITDATMALHAHLASARRDVMFASMGEIRGLIVQMKEFSPQEAAREWEEFRKVYPGDSNDPDSFIEWHKPVGEALASLEAKLSGVEADMLANRDIGKNARVFFDFMDCSGAPEVMAAHEKNDNDAAFDALQEKYGLSWDTLNTLRECYDGRFLMGVFSPDMSEKDVCGALVEVVRKIPFKLDTYYRPNITDPPLRMVLDDVSKTLPDVIEKEILPKMLAKHFPEVRLEPKKEPGAEPEEHKRVKNDAAKKPWVQGLSYGWLNCGR